MSIRHAVTLLVLATLTLTRPDTSQGDDAERGMPERVKEMLHWLPSDTETVIVANGPFEIPAQREGESPGFEDGLKTLSVCLFAQGLLKDGLQGQRIEIAMEGIRRFRYPGGLGLMSYEGCHLMRFEDASDAALQTALKSCIDEAHEVIRVHEQQVAVFRKKSENHVWTLFVSHPQKGLLLIATHRGYLEDVLQRIQTKNQKRAFPASLPEWGHVDFKARVWGVRHYRKEEAHKDPSSPLRPRAPANVPDSNAAGFVFSYDAEKKLAKVHYLSAAKNAVKIVATRWHNPPANLTPTIVKLQPGVVEVSSSVADDSVARTFLSILLIYLGHGVYV